MIHAMTDAKTVDTATLLGRVMLVSKLGELQYAHLLRYLNIITNSSVGLTETAEAVDRFLTIIHKSFKDPEDLKFVIRAEEDGDISFQDLIEALNGTNGAAPKPAVKRVGRPRKS
jgi:hypothetical protein